MKNSKTVGNMTPQELQELRKYESGQYEMKEMKYEDEKTQKEADDHIEGLVAAAKKRGGVK